MRGEIGTEMEDDGIRDQLVMMIMEYFENDTSNLKATNFGSHFPSWVSQEFK